MSEMPVTVRFAEFGFYDIQRDADVLMLQAITNVGTWTSIVESEPASAVRAKREAFKQFCLTSMSLGQAPREVNLG